MLRIASVSAMARLLLLVVPLAATSVPLKMRAGALMKPPSEDFELNLEDLEEVTVPVPIPEGDEVLIEVAGASLSPCEWKMMQSPQAWTWTYPHVSGFDVAGTVAAVGENTTRLKVGDKVWAFSINMGAHAEYVAVPERYTGLAPESITLADAGAIPLVALTVLEAFRYARGPWHDRDATVVILGGSGGNGHVAVQMAKAWGASKVITTCDSNVMKFCESLGADQVINHDEVDFNKALKPQSVDFIYDAIAAKGTGSKAYPLIKDGGFFVTLLHDAIAGEGVARTRPFVSQTSYLLSQRKSFRDLEVIRDIVDKGQLFIHVNQTFGIAELPQAFNTSMQGHIVGKLHVLPSKHGSSFATV